MLSASRSIRRTPMVKPPKRGPRLTSGLEREKLFSNPAGVTQLILPRAVLIVMPPSAATAGAPANADRKAA